MPPTFPRKLLDPPFPALALLLALSAALYLGGLFANRDAFQAYAFFNFSYSNLLHSGEFPQWLPSATYGTPAAPYTLAYLNSFSIVALLLGALLRLDNAWLLFFIANTAELALFVLSMHALARKLYRSNLAVQAVTVGAVFLSCWPIQIFWMHRLSLYLPLALYFLLRFRESGEIRNVLKFLCLFVLSLPGNVIYMAPIYALLHAFFLTALCAFSRAWPRIGRQSLLAPGVLVPALALVLLAACLYGMAGHVLDGVVLTATGRTPGQTALPLEEFLTYGGLLTDKLPEFFLGVPVLSPEMFLYLGAAAVSLILLAIRHNRQPAFFAVLALTAFVLLVALGPYGGVDYVLYYALPFAKNIRHLAWLGPMIRPLGLLLAGFGLEVLDSLDSKAALRSLGVCLAAAAGVFLALKWTVFAGLSAQFPGYSWARFLPEAAIALLAAALAVPRLRGGPALALILCLELAAANAVLLSSDPVFVRDGRFASPAIDLFAAPKPVFQPGRVLDPADEPKWPALIRLALRMPVHNPTSYLLVGIEPCVPIFRVDYATPEVHRLLEQKAPGALTASNLESIPRNRLTARHWTPALRDQEFLALCGCGGGKLVLDPGTPAARDASPGVTRFSANRLAVRVDQNEPVGLLYYADSFHPGWKALLDGAPVPVRQVAAFKAVEVPRGRHEVEFVFYDPLRQWSLIGFGVVSAAAVGAFLVQALRRGRAGQEG